MLGLYLYTLIIGHKSCNILSRRTNITLQKELQNCVTNNVFLTKNKNKITTQKKIKHKNPCRSRDISHPKRLRYRWTTESTDSIDCSQAI